MSSEIVPTEDVAERVAYSARSSGVDTAWWRGGTVTDELLLTLAVVVWATLLVTRSVIAGKLFHVSFPLEFEALAENPARVQLVLMGWQLVAGAGFIVAFLRVRALRDSVCVPASWRTQLGAFTIGLIAAFAANEMNIWPFSFRWPEDSSLQYLSNLRHLRATSAVLLFAVSATIITPLLEEIVFRFWALRWGVRLGRPFFGIVVSAGLFALLHAPDLGSILETRTFNTVFWTFVLGCVLASMVSRTGGRIAASIALHAGVNAAWLIAALRATAVGA